MTRLETALSITGKFEGSGYDNVTGNFDGEGLSAGILQWNYGCGSLQPLLKLYQDTHGSITGFPEDINASAHMSTGDGIAFARTMQDQTSHITPEWKASWRAFLSSPEVIAVQQKYCQKAASAADKLSVDWGMNSTRAFCWFFDLVVNNGGLKGVTKPKGTVGEVKQALDTWATKQNKKLWSVMESTEEMKILFVAAYERTKLSRTEFRVDTFNRKATIAMGKGFVHGELFDLKQLAVG
jgi:hypothetical protein